MGGVGLDQGMLLQAREGVRAGVVMVDQGLLLQAGGEGVLGNQLLEMIFFFFYQSW